MGNANQWRYLQRCVPRIHGTIVEIGSKQYGTTMRFRKLLRHTPYIGIDLEPGEGVDVVGDLTTGLCGLWPGAATMVICCSVLEHVAKPWLMAQNITTLLQTGGILYVTAPWVWRFHAYPDDYWRFSWRGVETLFPDLKWSHRYYSTLDGEFIRAVLGADDQMAHMEGERKYLPYLQLHMLGRKQ